MLYDIDIRASGSSVRHARITKIMAQRLMESCLQGGVDFTLVIKNHIHNHLWYSNDRRSNGDVNFMCEDCDETFKLSQTVLTACHAGEAAAQEHGF